VHESFDLDVFWAEAYGRVLPRDVTEAAEAALADCDEVVFEAEATSRLYEHLVPADRRSLVPYGVDAAGIDAYVAAHPPDRARAELGLDPDALVLACIGTVEARKGQLALVRAFSRIPADRRTGVQLAFTGVGDSPYSHALRTAVADAGLADVVTLHPVTPDIWPSYLAADVLVSASDIESVPRTMLEAMLMGRPVAATAAFGVGELVSDGETGFLCDPLELGELQAMLERVIGTDRGRLAEMGRAARAHVLRAHDPAIYVDHFAGRLSSWVRGSAPGRS
jgi:D-inositol-3-phosphate glycosyltransferase